MQNIRGRAFWHGSSLGNRSARTMPIRRAQSRLASARVSLPASTALVALTGQTYGLRVSGSSNAEMRKELGGQVQGVATLGGIPVSGFLRAAWGNDLVRDQTMGVGFASLPNAEITAHGRMRIWRCSRRGLRYRFRLASAWVRG